MIMKRSIKSATNEENNVTALFEEALDSILYHAGYEVKCDGTFPDIDIEVTCIASEKINMPEISLVINEFEEGMFDVIPTLTFPTLTLGDQDYADTIHYWLEKWERIGKYITQLNKFEFNLESALNYDED